MDPRVREDDVLLRIAVIPGHDRESMDPRVREDDGYNCRP
jgi:hypothetical protein